MIKEGLILHARNVVLFKHLGGEEERKGDSTLSEEVCFFFTVIMISLAPLCSSTSV